MNTTIWTGLTLTILGVGSFTAIEPLTAATITMFGLLLIGLGRLMHQTGRKQDAGALALCVGLLGLLTALDSFARTLSASGLALSQSIVTSIAIATICGLYLALSSWEHREQRQNRPSD